VGGPVVDGVLTVNENSPINVTFYVDANPPPDESSFQWFKDGVQVGSGRYFSLPAVDRQRSGTYVLNVTNAMMSSDGVQAVTGRGSGSIQLNVLCK
jgi:hypothetical protein